MFVPESEEHDERRPRAAPASVVMVVAGEPLGVYHTLNLLAGLLASLGIAAIVAMGAVLSYVVNRRIRPVRRLAGEIESLRETDLSHRFEHADVPAELAPMIDKLNGLLERLNTAFSREKAFTADVAHELRTPLTGLRMTMEVCRSQPRNTAAYETAIDECRAIVDRMETMVVSLLTLARSDAGQIRIEQSEIDITQLITETWQYLRYRADEMGASVDVRLPPSCVIVTDPERLRIILQNVLDNAVSYVNRRGTIRIVAAQEPNAAIIEVANSGSQIRKQDITRLFERFWRGDDSRADSGGHTGLGLSLTQRLTEMLGGKIICDTVEGGEFVVRIELPK